MYLFIHAAEREHSFLLLVWKMGSGSIFEKNVPDPIFPKSNAQTKNKELVSFLTFDDCIVFMQALPFRRKKSPDVLRGIDELLKKFTVKSRDLKGICVLSGPGQFSFLRTSVVTANTFGLALHIPVVGIESTEFATEKEFVEKGLKKMNLKKRFHPVAPAYGKEPNITLPKKNV